MGRLDVRVRTKLHAKVIYISRDEKVEEPVFINEISLSSAVVTGLSTELKELFTLRTQLPDAGELELLGKYVRRAGSRTAIRIFCSDKNTLQQLWGHIRKNL